MEFRTSVDGRQRSIDFIYLEIWRKFWAFATEKNFSGWSWKDLSYVGEFGVL